LALLLKIAFRQEEGRAVLPWSLVKEFPIICFILRPYNDVQVLVLFISSLNQLLFRSKSFVCYFSKCSYHCYYFSRLLRWTTWAV